MQFVTFPFRSRETPSLTEAPAASVTSSLDKRVQGSGASPDAVEPLCAPTAHVTHVKMTMIIRLVTTSSEARTSVRVPECLHATRSASLRLRNRGLNAPHLIAATGDAPRQPIGRNHSICDGSREIVSLRNEMGYRDDRPIAQRCKMYRSVRNSVALAGEDASASAPTARGAGRPR
jgi:hypothetical protein